MSQSSLLLSDAGLPAESRVLESSPVDGVRCGLKSEPVRGPEAVGALSWVSTWGYHSAFPNSGGPGVASVTISACWGASRDTHFRIGRGSERDCSLRGGRGGGLFRFSPGLGA